MNSQLKHVTINDPYNVSTSKISWFLILIAYSDLCYISAYKSTLWMGKDKMENSTWLWARRLGVRARNLRNPSRKGKIILLKWRRACGLSNLPWLLATSNYQEVLLQQVQVTINSKSKLLSSGIEPWSVMWNCSLNYGFAGNYWVESPGTPLDAFVHLLAYWTIAQHVVTQNCKIVSEQNIGAKKTVSTMYNKG